MQDTLKKDVVITIMSRQAFEGCEPDHIDLVTRGRLYRKKGKYFISYDESELTGLQGSRTTLKLDGPNVTMTRTGTFPTQMLFSEHQRHVGLYQTEAGAMTISTHTSHVRNTIGENGGNLEIDYSLEVDSNFAGENRFEMAVSLAGEQ